MKFVELATRNTAPTVAPTLKNAIVTPARPLCMQAGTETAWSLSAAAKHIMKNPLRTNFHSSQWMRNGH
jgi:hypothetical protein